ncbi:hypothetical protein PAL_GLEAN10018030 [Pteropus alecto]|uniref:Uncharacterized protein n=1 Tax=Pteropus alecto TaxID=9402 RepID=L5KX31_PTEAL|nr:hypothetical protein PAL_GLEAN10018030 [Pteropus alecto]
MASWVLRLLSRPVRSLTTSSGNQRVEDCHRHHEAYGYFLPIQTRWQDNDQYGKVNNVVYDSYFDTIINHYLNQVKASVRDAEEDLIALPVERTGRGLTKLVQEKGLGNQAPVPPLRIYANISSNNYSNDDDGGVWSGE